MSEERKMRIIIVDDDDFLVNMYAAKFQKSGVEVVASKSGSDLMEKLRNGEKVDLILLDIVLPGTDGVAVLEGVRHEKLAENTPVIMLTNQSDEQDIAKANKLGIDGYIVKAAATPSEVVEQVINVINKKK